MRILVKRFIENLYRHTLNLLQFIWEIKTLRTAAARGLSLLLTVALIFSVLPPPAFALTESDFEVIWLEGEYERIADFSSEGFAMVYKNSKIGFIDTSGREAVPCIYGTPYDFYARYYNLQEYFDEGLALMSKTSNSYDEKYGWVDFSGKEVIPFVYDDAWYFVENLAIVKKDDKWGVIDRSGKEVVPFIYEFAGLFSEGIAAVEKDGKWGHIDRTGRIVVPLIYDYAGLFSEGMAAVEKDGKWGYVDKMGREIIPIIYDYVSFFHDGMAGVRKGSIENGKWAYIDKTGKKVTSFIYDSAQTFSEGRALVRRNNKDGYIDKTGKEVIPCEYDYANSFSGGIAAVGRAPAGIIDYTSIRYGFIDTNGNEIVPCIYDIFACAFSPAKCFYEGMAKVSKNSKYGFVNKKGEIVVPLRYDNPFGYDFHEGLAAIEKDGKWGYVDKTGTEVIPLIYDDTLRFSEGMAWVMKDGKYGYIDLTGRVVIPFVYDYASDFSEGMATVKKEGRWFLLRRKTGILEKSKILINGVEKDIEAYKVRGDHYYKLRDIAYLLRGSKSQFHVVWNEKKKQTEMKLGKPYIPVGTELSYSPGPKNITSSKVSVLVDGSIKVLSAQVIDGRTYYKLSELASVVGFKVFWDKQQRTVSIRTGDTRKNLFYWINLLGSDSTIYNHDLQSLRRTQSCSGAGN